MLTLIFFQALMYEKNTKLGKIIIFSLVVFDNSVNKLFIHSEYLQSLNSHEQREITLN